MTLEERYRLLLEKKRHQEKYDPGLKDISILNAPDVIGEGLGEEVMATDADWSPEKRATLATIARIAPDTIGAFGGLFKGVYDAAKSGLYDDLPDIPSNFNQSGAIHGQNSKLFPPSWRGKEGRLKQLQEEGHSQDEIWDIARKETGFGIWDQPIYKDGQYARSDTKMNVPDINLKEGPLGVDDVEDLSTMQNYPAKVFRENTSLEAGYPDQYNAGAVQIVDDANMQGVPIDYSLGKHSNKGKVGYRVNQDAAWIPETEDSLLPKFAGADQGIIQDTERFATGGRPSDPNAANWAGNVEQRAVAQEFDTITDLREKGYSNLEIIEHLGNNPIYKTFDTPNILQQTVPRRDVTPTVETTGRVPSRYRKPEPEVRTEYFPVREEIEVPVKDEIPDETPGGYTEEEIMRMLSMRLDDIANYS